MKVFIVHMLRYGDRESHSYVLGAYTQLTLAQQEGHKERDYRANKYLPCVTEHTLDNVLVADNEGFWTNDDDAGEGVIVAQQVHLGDDRWMDESGKVVGV